MRLQTYRRPLQHLSPTLSAALQKWGDHRKLERPATTDGLTGLYNHGYFHEGSTKSTRAATASASASRRPASPF